MSASDRRPDRLAAVRAEAARAGYDALLVTSLPNIRYLTGFSGSSALLVVTAQDALLITDFRYRAQARAEASAVALVEIEPSSLWSRLWASLPRLGVSGVIAFESAHVTHADAQRFADAGARWQWRATAELVEAERQRKDDGEVQLIRRAIGVAEAALDATLPAIRPGATERSVAAALEFALRERGSEAHPFETIVASGPRSALPHARSSDRPIGDGELVIVDFGATIGGYCSDITRTFVAGRAASWQRDVHEVVLDANQRAAAAVRAGMRGREADAIARDAIEARGFGSAFGHSLGHGIGLEVHEAPRLSRASEAPLPAGAVVTIEPGVYLDEQGGVRIEDDVQVTDAGAVVLTSFSRSLIELG